MTLVCPKCSARYNIQDSLIPAQGARVKCKKCETVMTIPPPVVELAPQDLELIPPPSPGAAPSAPQQRPTPSMSAPPKRPVPPVAPPPPPPEGPFERGFVAERSPMESVDSEIAVDRPFSGTPNLPPADPDFERGGAPPRFGSPPSFTENAPPAPRIPEPPSRSPEPKPRTPEPLSDIDTALAMSSPAVAAEERPTSIPVPEATPRAAASFDAPATNSTSPAPAGTAIPAGLTADDQSKHEKARRLARVLASDIAIYNRDKRDRGIREGNLVAMLGYEIKKSREIYKERVGAEFANSTPYFRDALNEMLAEGKKIF
ncbi:MAG TPA: zinc-ribbon domain-containing protein [Candidatus Eisenbacteria bacterium]|nr:zinc-ribbon domain-containing protein [Candidatus Eisenbacteria bacterium]